jgi:multiple sugar transport system substrate-binding protein
MYFSESGFLSKYGGMFQAKYPHITVEVASMNNVFNSAEKYYEILDAFLEQHKPDILLLNPESYALYATEGKLYGLESLTSANQYDIQNLAKPVVQALLSKGGGNLYGLAPQFSNEALYYNKKLFDQNGVPYPTDRMSWQDVLTLARKFPSDGGHYGLEYMNSTSPFFFFTSMLRTHEVSPFDSKLSMVTVNTPAWNSLLQLARQAYQSGVIHPPKKSSSGAMSQIDNLKSSPFIAGKTAMFYSGSSVLRDLNMASQELKDEAPNWDLVTAPVNSTQPEYSNKYLITDIFAISAQTTKLRQAWELLKFMHSDEVARIMAVTEPFSLVTRIKQLKNNEGRNLEALWKLSYLDSDHLKVPLELNGKFWAMSRPKIESVFKEFPPSNEEILADIQAEGEFILKGWNLK